MKYTFLNHGKLRHYKFNKYYTIISSWVDTYNLNLAMFIKILSAYQVGYIDDGNRAELK